MSKSDINSRSFLVSKFGLQGKGKRGKEKDKAKKRAGRLGKLQEYRGSVALPCRVRVLPGCFRFASPAFGKGRLILVLLFFGQ
uniref:Uncharacterized protein n=1 Tax=Manihot esculenta TaxID=3983 RepID=A0A2C9UE21_MANES